jgi:hypothetical protein
MIEQKFLVPYPPPSSMSHPYPGNEPSVEQLVRAFTQILNPNSPLRKWVYTQFRVLVLAQPVLQKVP